MIAPGGGRTYTDVARATVTGAPSGAPQAGGMKTSPLTTTIEPPRGWMGLNTAELWQYRELLWFLSWRDIKVKYKQTLLGFAWAVLVPVTNMLIFGTIFGRVAGLPTNQLNPFLFYLAVLVPWTYFSNSLTMSSNSMVQDAPMLTKIYFPRLYSPLGPLIANLVDLAIGSVIVLGVMLAFGVLPAATIALVPIFVLMMMLTALGVGLLLSAVNVRYRDVRHMIPFIVQIWMYGTVILGFAGLPERLGAWRYLYGLNPMVGAVEGFRWSLLQHRMVEAVVVDGVERAAPVMTGGEVALLAAAGLPAIAVLLVLGLWYFKRTERIFADVV